MNAKRRVVTLPEIGTSVAGMAFALFVASD
jgi:hypothetical protein